MFNALRTVSVERIAGFFVFATLGVLAVSQPFVACGLLVASVASTGLAYFLLSRSALRLWQVLVLIALSGYIVLDYGFANVAFHIGGLPIILGHGLMFAGLTFALLDRRSRVVSPLREPAILSLAGFILLSVIHLCYDVPRYGLMALRDASLPLEGVFILTGWLWGTEELMRKALTKWLFAVFVANLLYSFTFPWAESVTAWSPKSGIFLVVPIFGWYAGSALYLLTGALFCLWVARDAIKLPNWVFWLLAVGQVLGLALYQARSMYIGILVVLLMLPLMGEIRKWARLATALALALVAILFFASVVGLEVPGRLGPATPDFLIEHARSLFLAPGTPGIENIYGRVEWDKQVWNRAQSTTANLLIGEGFGKPLIDFHDEAGTAVRQPHNVHLTVLARLGLVGAVFWTLFHLSIISRFARALHSRPRLDRRFSALVLWLFLFYILSMILATVQAQLDFSFGAIPFYFLVGFTLGIIGPGYLPAFPIGAAVYVGRPLFHAEIPAHQPKWLHSEPVLMRLRRGYRKQDRPLQIDEKEFGSVGTQSVPPAWRRKRSEAD